MTAGPTGQQAILEGKPIEFSGKPLYYEDLALAVKKGEADWRRAAQLRRADRCTRTAPSPRCPSSGTTAST